MYEIKMPLFSRKAPQLGVVRVPGSAGQSPAARAAVCAEPGGSGTGGVRGQGCSGLGKRSGRLCRSAAPALLLGAVAPCPPAGCAASDSSCGAGAASVLPGRRCPFCVEPCTELPSPARGLRLRWLGSAGPAPADGTRPESVPFLSTRNAPR